MNKNDENQKINKDTPLPHNAIPTQDESETSMALNEYDEVGKDDTIKLEAVQHENIDFDVEIPLDPRIKQHHVEESILQQGDNNNDHNNVGDTVIIIPDSHVDIKLSFEKDEL